MPQFPKTTWLIPPFERQNRVLELMEQGHGLVEAEKLASMTFDEAAEKANEGAIKGLVEWLESQTEGEKAVETFWSRLSRWGCRVENGEWTKEQVALNTPDAFVRFKREACFYAAFHRLITLRRILNGGAYLKGTAGEFRLMALIAFEAGAHYAEAEMKKETGRKKKPTEHTERLLRSLQKAERAVRNESGKSRAQISAKEIFGELAPPAVQTNGRPYSSHSEQTMVSKMRLRYPE